VRLRNPRAVAVRAAIALVLLLGVAGCWWWRDPLAFPGSHPVTVYGLDEPVSGPPAHPPNILGRLFGRCDADSSYVRDGNTWRCLVLTGPLAVIHVVRQGGQIVIQGQDLRRLREVATGQDTRHLVLSAHGTPICLVPVTALSGAGPLRLQPLHPDVLTIF
jgi:hypothetical protein